MTFLAATASSLALAMLLTTVLTTPRRQKAHKSLKDSKRPDLDVSSLQFWTTSVGVGAATFFVIWATTGLIVVALVPAIVVSTLPNAYYGRKRAQQITEVQESWPDGLRDLVSSVRSGASLPSAIEAMGAYGPAPLRSAFGGFGVYSRSLGIVPALEMVRADLADPTSDRVIEVLILAHQRGGNVVPQILSDLAEATTRDVWTLEQVRSEALEQKINSRVVFVLPWIVLVVMTTRSGAFREFYSTPGGIGIVVVCGLLSLLGIFIAGRLGSQPVEPRVFKGPAS